MGDRWRDNRMSKRSHQYYNNRGENRRERDHEFQRYNRSLEEDCNKESSRENYSDVSYNSSNYLSSTDALVMYIDPNDIGRLIGKGGSKIRALQDESNAKINVSNTGYL